MTGEFAIAVHAIVYLNHKQSYLSSEELAKNVCTNPARIRMVMGRLKKAGLIETREGINGGYAFTGDPATLTLHEIGEAAGAKFVGAAWRSGDVDMECLVASGMADIMDGIYAEMDSICKERLRTITIQDIDDMIFRKGKGLKDEPDKKRR